LSVVVCKVTKHKIKVACDSQVTAGDYIHPRSSVNKYDIRVGKKAVLFGCGYVEELNLFQYYALKIEPLPKDTDDLIMYMSDFYKFRDEHTDKLVSKNNESLSGSSFLLIYQGKAFYISDLLIEEVLTWKVMGDGDVIAAGALDICHDVRKAAKVACKFVTSCGPPIKYFEFRRGK
jgi:ATP-dependent protease HslVU (ClpYQ) peptidase subunit